MPAFSPWQVNQYPGGDAPFNTSNMGGPPPFYRDQLDYLRSGQARTPESMYPDGYLGTINTRRSDRLLDGLKQRQAAGPKVRGIHKGEQMDARDYYWQPEFNPDSGLISEAATAVDTLDGFLVQRYASPGLVNDPMAPEFMSPRRANILSRQGGGQGMTPPWSTPPAPVQGGLIGNQV
jgi:hypothetical protein